MGMSISTQGLVTLTYRMQHKQGRSLWVEATNRAVASAGTTAPVDQVIASLRDVSERKQAEEALRTREAQYRTLVEQAADAILIADATGKLVEANPRACKMLGYNRDELLQLQLDQVVNAEGMGVGYDQGTLLSERFAIQKDGDTLPVEMHAKQLLDGRLLAIVRDISERKEAENQRVELAVEKERVEVLQRFIGDASHDLRTPLAVMRTSLYILRRTQPELAEKGGAQITAIDDQITRMETLLRDTLTMSRLDRADADEFTFAPCNINEIVQGVVERHSTAAQDKRVTLSFAPEQTLPMLRADSEQLARAVANVVKNAISYTGENGIVQVRTYQQHEDVPMLLIEVKDNGIGINSLDLPHVFERFYRADPARRSVGAGMGLGLPIARRIVQAHGGEIRVESTPGEGSIFAICLPIKPIV
jgi:two-component system, OmpR family, sensor histidine kinase VicK